MQDKQNISKSVIRRLPRYYRFLEELRRSGREKISSRELSESMRLTASQIRQDLNCFGGFGQQGYGYNVSELCSRIGEILGLDGERKAVLIGAGNLGRAVSQHIEFSNCGFRLIGIFDRDEAVIGEAVAGVHIRRVECLRDFCETNTPEMAVLCVPRESAKDLVRTLWSVNVRTFWNFSHYDILADYPEATVENVHLTDSLMTLSYGIKNCD